MSDLPILLAVVHKLALHDVIQQHGTEFRIHWSVDLPHTDDPRSVVFSIAELRPTLIVLELDQPIYWLAQVHSDPVTRRIPMIGIADNPTAHQQALLSHVETILTADEFLAQMPQLLLEKAKIFTAAAELSDLCDQAPSEMLLKGLHEFNAQEYFECHETLETAWRAETAPIRNLYQAILQVGIAYYQIQRRNYEGAIKMFLRATQWFAPLPDRCQGVDVAQLKADASTVRQALEALGLDRIAEFDLSLLKPISYDHG